MSLVAFPPTSVRFLASCPKPDAFVPIAAATIDQVLSSRATRAINIALSDSVGRDVSTRVQQTDDGFEGIVFALAARDLMSSRGYDRAAGADDEITKRADEASAELQMMAPGAAGKRLQPFYVLTADVTTKDAVRVTSSPRADAWARRETDPLRYRA